MVIPVYCPAALVVVDQAGALMQHWINYLSTTLLVIGLFWLLLSDSRRSLIIAYCVVAIMVFSINIQYWTFGFALSKLITSIMSMVVLSLASVSEDQTEMQIRTTGRVFRAVGFGFCLLLIFFTINASTQFLSLSIDQTLPALAILICGFLMLGISRDPFRIITGLLTVLAGFEIIYGAVEKSLLINGLLAAACLLIAVVGSYLIMPVEGEEQR